MRFENDEELYKNIGLKIKHFREQSGLTQVQLADKLQISISYLSKLEASGCKKSLSISLLNHIANTLKVDIQEFLSN